MNTRKMLVGQRFAAPHALHRKTPRKKFFVLQRSEEPFDQAKQQRSFIAYAPTIWVSRVLTCLPRSVALHARDVRAIPHTRRNVP
jgi:hypothetical protein